MGSWLGGGVLLLVAAGLWLVYLVPNWLRRSEYLATERNAVRLQQTIRVLAETAETPEAVRIESAAKARKVVAETLAARPVAVGTAPRLPLPAELDPAVRAARRLRRTRLVTAAVLLLGVVVLGWQAIAMLAGGLEAGSTMLVAIAGLVVIGSAALLGRLGRAARTRARALSARAASGAPSRQGASSADALGHRPAPALDLVFDANVPLDRAWTPQPLPQPLGQVRREAALAAARAEAARNAAAGAAETERSATAAQRAEKPSAMPSVAKPGVASSPASPASAGSSIPGPVPAAEPSARPVSRYAAMGVIDVPAGSGLDLASAIARRRAS